MNDFVPFVITHDAAAFTLAALAEANIEVRGTYDVRSINMEEAPLEADDAWAWAAQLYGDCVPDAVPFIVMIDPVHCDAVKAHCRRILGKLDADESILPQR